jgi:O-antigen/teichoic acid export membrane protein
VPPPYGTAAPEPVAPPPTDHENRRGRKQLGREALIYLIGMVLGRAASLIMLPVYTRVLTPADYGVLQLLDMTSDVVAILVSAGCTAGVMRFYFKADTERERRSVLGSAMTLQVGLNLVGTALLVLFAQPIWQYALHGAHHKELVYLAAANFTLGSLAIVPLIFMQIEKKALVFSMVSVARLVMQLSGNIIFLVVLRWGPAGILISSLIVNVVIGTATVVWMVRRIGIVVSRKALVDLRRFGLPYQFATLGTFIFTFGDRLFLDKYGGLAVVGLYSIAYQFGFMLGQIGIDPFMRAWTPRRFEYVRGPRDVRDAENIQGFRYFNCLALTAATAIAVFVHPVLRLLAHEEYWQAANIVPIILAAYVVQGWATVVELGIDVSERTKYASYSVWASVAACLALYTLLIPRFGAAGAAWATLLGFLVRFFFHWRFSQRLWPLSYGWKPTLRLASNAVIVTLAAFSLRPARVLAEFSLATTLLAGYMVAVWTTILHDIEKREIRAFAVRCMQTVTSRFAIA